MKYQDAVNHFQNLVYGNPISENPEEVAFVLDALWQRFHHASGRLNDSDQKTFQEFLERFQAEPEVASVPTPPEVLGELIHPEHIETLFAFVLYEIYGLSDWKAVVDANATMFSANSASKILTIPQSKIAGLSLFRLLQLFDHEIGTHALRGQNMLRTLGVAGAHYLEHEEGWAMLSEKLFTETPETLILEPTIHHITTFIAENTPAKETENLIRIYFLLAGIQENPADRMRRVKRFVSFELPGANRKDVSYTRGNLDIVQEWKRLSRDPAARKRFVQDFYFSKLSLSDQSYVPGMRESMNISDDDLVYPLWIGKILAKKLQGDSIFFNTRFPESDDRKNFLDGDGRFVVERITFDVQRKIVTLLKLIRSHAKDSTLMKQKNTTK